MIKQDNLKQKIYNLPEAPGVYLFKDERGHIIYIGKAKSLKKRVNSYFTRFLSDKTQALVSRIADLEYILTPSEAHALLLESSLIKEKQPHYNISLKDDKSFPLIRISKEEFPVITICRKTDWRKDQRGEYFGPYTSAALLREALTVIRKVFGFRSCKTLPKQACLYCRLKLCPAPCAGKISCKEYQELINRIKLFLDSRYEELLNQLVNKMRRTAEEKNFEEAARVRDQINALSVFGRGMIHSAGLNEIEDLKELLGLKKSPQRIETFDISNISGKEACGSMVSFYKGMQDKNNYRRFRIKLQNQIDDYAMIKEVVTRRYQRLKRENLALPDLILIDGGKGHLMTAAAVLRGLDLKIPLASIAKEREHIYFLGRKNPIKLNQDTPGLNLIRRARDEAHRFALSYHHILRRKKIIGK